MNKLYPPHSSLVPGSRVVAYLRDSGGMEQEDSVNRQEEELRRWCAQYSLELIAIYTDEARTARHSLHKRKDLLSMMAHLRDDKDVMGVIVWNYERFARNIKHGRVMIAEIEALNRVFCSLTDFIPEGIERYLYQDLKLLAAESTSLKISIDVTSGIRRMVETHGGMPGTPPRGMRRGEAIIIGKHRDGTPRIVHRWEPDPDLRAAVLLAFQMRAAGATIQQIMDATQLYKNINSYTTFFANRKYMGELVFADMVIQNYCEPIVDRVTWELANLVSKQRNRTKPDDKNHPRRLASHFLLSGLVYCQHCGSVMHGHVISGRDKTRRDEYYACTRKMRRRDCRSREVPRLALEQAITDQLIEKFLEMDNLLAFQNKIADAYTAMNDSTKTRRIAINRKMTAIKKRISNLSNTLAELGPSKAIYNSLKDCELEEQGYRLELEKLEQNKLPIPAHTTYTLKQLADQVEHILRNGSEDQRRQYLHGFITRIIARRDVDGIRAVVSFVLPQGIPPVCLSQSALAEEQSIDIHNVFYPMLLKRKAKLMEVS